ncbi:EthD family reductase [Gordonia sp. OPL2]|uniref:EthD family reductase n=1 Tax=Gordonia sp. OPL2 TaxID=2486274 RepID=UPI00165500D1|nr:EthD family reductase [Gordonia sp. OPL2]
MLFVVHRKPELSRAEFLAHYRDVHFPIATTFPDLLSYEVFPLPATESDDTDPDAFAVMTFESAQAFESAVASPQFAEAVADNESFVASFDTFTVDHYKVV